MAAGPGATNLFIKLGPLQLALTTVPRFEKNDMQWDLTPSSMHRLLLAMWERRALSPEPRRSPLLLSLSRATASFGRAGITCPS